MDLSNICLNCFKPKGGYDVCMHCGYVAGTAPEQAFHLHPGTILQGRYIIGTVVGFGGFGITYKVWDATLEAVTAVKEFFPSGLVSRVPGDAQVVIFSGEKQELYNHQLARFMEEARNMAKFDNSPQIVNVFDYFEANNTAYIVMEFLDGVTLKDHARDENRNPIPLDVDMALSVLEPMTHALEQMHMKGIIHRDVSPDNIFITHSGMVKLLDFGAARLSAEDREETLMAIIKPGYAPPEQYRSRSKQGPYTDVYGLGATLYRILTGITPDESVDRQVEDLLQRPSQLGVKLDPKLEKSVMKSMALKPELRFQSMKEFRDAVFANKNVDFPEDELKKRQRNRVIAVFASIVIMLGVVFSIGYAVSRPSLLLSAVELTPDTITVWLPGGGETYYNADIMNQLAGEFTKERPGINVEFVEIDVENYAYELEQARQRGEMPTLFHSGYAADDTLPEIAAPLGLLIDSIDTGSYHFIDNYAKWYPKALEIPMAFDVAVVYGNTSAAEYYQKTLPDAITAPSALTALERWNIWHGCYDDYVGLYGGALSSTGRRAHISDSIVSLWDMQRYHLEARYDPQTDPFDMLLEEEIVCLFAQASNLRTVQDLLPGFYQVIPVYGDNTIYGVFKDTWAVSAASGENQRNIAMLFLTYMLSDFMQDSMYVQNDSYMPLSKAVLSDYVAVNTDLSFVANEIRKVQFLAGDKIKLEPLGRELEDFIATGAEVDQNEFERIYKKYGLS